MRKLSKQSLLRLVVLLTVLFGAYIVITFRLIESTGGNKKARPCDENNMEKYTSDNDEFLFELCYPKNWKAVPNLNPDLNLPGISFNNSPIQYIQMTTLHHTGPNRFRETAYKFKGSDLERFRDLEKIIILRDNKYYFTVMEKVVIPGGLDTTILSYIINPKNEKQVMRLWYFYEDDDPLNSVREESRAFIDIVDSFRWVE